MNKTILIVGLAVLLGVIFLAAMSFNSNNFNPLESMQTEKSATSFPPPSPLSSKLTKVGDNPLNASYVVNGVELTLIDGEATTVGISTQVIGVPVNGDLNKDNLSDAAMILVQEVVQATSADRAIYYVVAAINDDGSYQGTNGVMLGVGVQPQNIQIIDQQVVASYSSAQNDNDILVQPSNQVANKYLQYQNGELVEVPPSRKR